MLRFGITKRGPIAQKWVERVNKRTGWRPFALTLLEEIQLDYAESDESLLEAVYANTSGGVGIHKMTRRGRMGELDERIAAEVDLRFADNATVSVHDMACSNAITSLELFQMLSRNRRVLMQATDYFDALWYVRVGESPWTVVFDSDFKPIQFVGRGFVISASHREPYRYLVNCLMREILMRTVLVQAKEALDNRLDRQGQSRSAKSTECVRKLQLFHPRCVQFAERCGEFQLGRQDIFSTGGASCHIIRVMNALTLHHFSAERVVAGIRAVAGHLECGGILVLGRSTEEADGASRATAYLWDGIALAPIWAINGGYEWPELVLKAFTSPAPGIA